MGGQRVGDARAERTDREREKHFCRPLPLSESLPVGSVMRSLAGFRLFVCLFVCPSRNCTSGLMTSSIPFSLSWSGSLYSRHIIFFCFTGRLLLFSFSFCT